MYVGSLQSFYDLMCLIKYKKYFPLPYTGVTIRFKTHLLKFLQEHTFAWVTAFACASVRACLSVCACVRVIYLSLFTLFLVTPIIDTKILHLVLSCISFQIIRISDWFKKTVLYTHSSFKSNSHTTQCGIRWHPNMKI